MHNRRSTTTCFRLTMVALKLFIPRHRMHKDNSYRLTMVALKLFGEEVLVALSELSLNHGRVETWLSFRIDNQVIAYGRVSQHHLVIA